MTSNTKANPQTTKRSEPFAIALPVLLSGLMSLSFTSMFAQTYEIPFSYLLFIPAILAYALLVSTLIVRRKGKLALVFVIASVILSGGAAALEYFDVMDVFHLKTSVKFLLCQLQLFTFHDMGLTFNVRATGEMSAAALLFILNMIPIALTCWVITRKKNILFSLVGFLPFFGLTIALNYSFPKQWSCLIALGCVVVMFLFQNMRKHHDEKTNRTILILLIAVMAIVVIVGAISPQEKYDMQDMAKAEVRLATSIYQKVGRYIKKIPSSIETLIKPIEENLPEDTTFKPLIETGPEYLNLIGDFNIEDSKLMEVRRIPNPNYSGPKYNDRYLYLKAESKGEYTGTTWDSTVKNGSFDSYYVDDMESQWRECQYFIDIDANINPSNRPVPLYTDFYTGQLEDSIHSVYLLDSSALMEEVPNAKNARFIYACNNIPTALNGRLQDGYIRKVNAEYLAVPTTTRDGILGSGKLPTWFTQCYYGQREMSDREKVERVLHFVRNLCPYNEHTKSMPSDQKDFVVWFMTQGETGYCVHFASTAAILLRMLGVPTRYVKGYMLNNLDDDDGSENYQPTKVYTTDAHAWIEVFDENYGWIMCDPTPDNENAERGFSFEAIYGNRLVKSFEDDPDPVSPTTEPSATVPENTPVPDLSDATPTPESQSERTPTPAFTARSEESDAQPMGTTGKVIVGVFAVILLIAMLRLIYIVIWLRKLKGSSRNASARAYYRYFRMILNNYGKRPSHRLTALAQRAAFSQEGLTDEQFKTLVDSGKEMIAKAEKESRVLRRLFGRHILGIPRI